MGKKDGKPRGRMSSYACFVQSCREEHKKSHPNESVDFQEFSKKCAEKWKKMTDKEKKRFEDMAAKDKIRYEKEMSHYIPPKGEGKRKKDPNAPKKPLSAFFHFSAEFRAGIKARNPDMGIGDIAKELGKRWEQLADKSKYEALNAKDKARYEREMAAYRKKGGSPSKKRKGAASAESDESDEE